MLRQPYTRENPNALHSDFQPIQVSWVNLNVVPFFLGGKIKGWVNVHLKNVFLDLQER